VVAKIRTCSELRDDIQNHSSKIGEETANQSGQLSGGRAAALAAPLVMHT
jgi:hypothetical protein